MVMGILLLIVAVLLGVWISFRSARWKVLETATGPNAEELHAKYEHLKSNHIKCVLETDSTHGVAPGFVQADMMADAHAASAVMKLKVHQDYMKQAKELLEEYPAAM